MYHKNKFIRQLSYTNIIRFIIRIEYINIIHFKQFIFKVYSFMFH